MTDTNLQFDFLPVNVKRSEEKQSYTNKMQSNLEAYFNDQRLRQANKAQRNVRSMSKNVSSLSIDESKKASGAKKRIYHITLNIKKPTKEKVDKTQPLS